MFNSFFWGGFECADHINRSGERINLLKETGHDVRVAEDYELLSNIGIRVAREGVVWSIAETSPYKFDFTHLNKFFEAAKKFNFQIVWDLCHFGYPDDLIPTHPQFTERFKALCIAFVNYHKTQTTDPLMVVPINEISFLSWHSGDVRGTVPFAVNSGDDIKYHLCKAAIGGIKILKAISPRCVVFGVEPLIKIHAADDNISTEELALINDAQFMAMDIILGKACPELNGSSDLIDIMGFNYYYNNQWDNNNVGMPWPSVNEKFVPFAELLRSAFYRFGKPVVLTETGHFGLGRDIWIKEITQECIRALGMGIDIRGICIYPIIDRPDWDDLSGYYSSGIWDLGPDKERLADIDYLQACIESINTVELREVSRSTKNVSEKKIHI